MTRHAPPWPAPRSPAGPETRNHRKSRATITRAAGHAIQCQNPAAPLAGPNYQAGGGSRRLPAGERPQRRGKTRDPAGVPFRQPVPMPVGIPADNGIPAQPSIPRQWPIRTFRRTPRLIQNHACKTIWRAMRMILALCSVLLICIGNLACVSVFMPRPSPSPAPALGARLRVWPGEGGGRGPRARVARARGGAGGRGAAPRPARGRGRRPARNRAPAAGNRATANCAFGMRSRGAISLRNPKARAGKVRNSAGKWPEIFSYRRRKTVDARGIPR